MRVAGAVRRYAAMLGVDPGIMAKRVQDDRIETDLGRFLEGLIISGERMVDRTLGRVRAAGPTRR